MPRRPKRELTGHEVRTVQEMGWAGVGNGILLQLASVQFDAELPVDQGIQYQQNVSSLRISVVVLVGASNDIDDLRPLLPALETPLVGLQPGQVVRVSA